MKYLTVNVLRILNTAFGTLFLFSGLMKLLNLHEFEKTVRITPPPGTNSRYRRKLTGRNFQII